MISLHTSVVYFLGLRLILQTRTYFMAVIKDSARFEIGRNFLRQKNPVPTALFFSLKDYLDERKLRLWDFFRKIDKDGTMRVPVADFRKAVQLSN